MHPLTHFLRWYLGILHDYVLRDWGLAIIVLVLCVRTLLHPVTKFSQTSMMRFGKQMQGLAPKQKKLQEKFKDDPKKLRKNGHKLIDGLLGIAKIVGRIDARNVLRNEGRRKVEARVDQSRIQLDRLLEVIDGLLIVGVLVSLHAFVELVTRP